MISFFPSDICFSIVQSCWIETMPLGLVSDSKVEGNRAAIYFFSPFIPWYMYYITKE